MTKGPSIKSKKFSLHKILYIISPLLITSGIASIIFRFDLLRFIKNHEIVLTPNSRIGTSWKDFPHNTRDFYFFNWTNPEDIYNKTVKPKFEEVGPYKFYEHTKKSDLVWNDNGTVTYKQTKLWYYMDEENNGNLQDRITTLNPVALTSAFMSRNWNYLLRKGLSWVISGETSTINMTRTVGEMTFEGYPDNLLSYAQSMPLGSNRPPFDHFGWFYQRNGSKDYEGIYNIGTGEKKTTLGELYRWNYLNETPHYHDDCAKFEGSAGELFESYSGKDTVRLFAPDLCKMFMLKYTGQQEVNNIVGYKYTAEGLMLDNGTIYPQNKCSCNGECLPSGVLNVTSCKFGSPSFFSLPHFYKADPYYLSAVEGLVPDRRKHETYITVEPITGVPLETRVRVQVNMLLQPFSFVPMYRKVPKLVFPMFWFDEKMALPKSDVFILKLLLFTPITSIIAGTVTIICGLLLLVYSFWKKKSTRTIESMKRKYFYLGETAPLNY